MPLSSQDYLPHISYDSVIFGFSGEKLKILILEYHDQKLYSLPGGFVKIDEPLDEAVTRGLMERTGLDKIYLEQFHTFGNLRRKTDDFMKAFLVSHGIDTQNHWLLDRFVTVGYYALINYEEVTPTTGEFADSIRWYDFDDLPELMMDHKEIVDKALEHLRRNLDQKLLSFPLLPERFTMKELQQVYECILGEAQNRANFQRKILSLNVLDRHEKLFAGGSHKAPFLYSFRK